ncbi:hypothetical protein [Streptacidiphilus carbonis]|uniref:hypothetical protein n=1 Tax=Streptacidiphilus carbonis TaxID=105422 RepID=UPI0005AB6BE1|nr:hypothetical protein [Streptacidiphilus carbonis]
MRRNQRGSGRGLLWVTGVAVAAVLGLTGYAALSGSSHNSATPSNDGTPSSSSAPTSSASPIPVPTVTIPSTWTEPLRWLAMPRGARTVANGDQVGFPQTADGAVAMLVSASTVNVEGATSTADQQLAIYNTYMDAADKSAASEQQIRDRAAQTEASERSALGLPASGPLPSGAFVRTNVVGFKVIQSSPVQVTAFLLTKVSQKAGETVAEKDDYTVTTVGVVWQGGDWKLSIQASTEASQSQAQVPAIAAPGDAAFNDAGWTAIRQAS